MAYKFKYTQSEVGEYATGKKIKKNTFGENWMRYNEIQRYGKRVTYKK